MIKRVLLLTTVIILSACGGGGGGDGDSGGGQPAARPSGKVAGVAFDNLLRGANISVEDLSGHQIATGKTDDQGKYSITLDQVPAQPLRIVASNGYYQEEYSNRNVSLDQTDKLYALINYNVGDEINISLTYFSTLATGYAEYLIDRGSKAADAIDQANALMSSWIGVDIVNTTPVDILDIANQSATLTRGLQYAFQTAAVSTTTANIAAVNGTRVHELYNSIKFIALAYDDIKYDGLLNGQGESGALSMGLYPITEQTYRFDHALNILAIANNPNNLTHIDASQLVTVAEHYNNFSNTLFAQPEATQQLDTTKPDVSVAALPDNSPVYGQYVLDFDATDVSGLASISVQLGNQPAVLVADLSNPSVTLNTSAVPDGNATLTIVATNVVGGVTTVTRTVVVTNNGLSITNLQPAQGQVIRGLFNFGAVVADPIGVRTINFVIDGSLHFDGISPSKVVQAIDTRTTFGADGSHTFRVDAENVVGGVLSSQVTFTIDNTNPTITWGQGDNSYLSGDFSSSISVADNIGLASAKSYIDGQLLADFNPANAASISGNVAFSTLSYAEGSHALTVQAIDRAGNSLTATRNAIFDNAPPTLVINTPMPLVLTQDGAIKATAQDTVGFGTNTVHLSVDGAEQGSGTPIASAASTGAPISVTGYTEGTHAVVVSVQDASGKSASQSFNVDFRHIAPSISATYNAYGRDPGNNSDQFYYTWTVGDTQGEALSLEVDSYVGVRPKSVTISGNTVRADFKLSGYSDVFGVQTSSFRFRVTDAYGLVSEWKTWNDPSYH